MDPSLTGFGWCIHNSVAEGLARIVKRGVLKSDAKTIFVQRYMDFRSHVAALLTENPEIEVVGIESPVYGEQWSSGAYALFVYITEMVYTHKKDVVFFDPGTVKMLAKIDHEQRKGQMFKVDMVNAAKADTGVKGKFNHNEADAYHVARFTARFFSLLKGDLSEKDLSPAEKQAFINEHTFKRGPRKGLTERNGALYKEGSRFFCFSRMAQLCPIPPVT